MDVWSEIRDTERESRVYLSFFLFIFEDLCC